MYLLFFSFSSVNVTTWQKSTKMFRINPLIRRVKHMLIANARFDYYQLELRSSSHMASRHVTERERWTLSSCSHRCPKQALGDIPPNMNVLTVPRNNIFTLFFSISEWCRSACGVSTPSDLWGPRSLRASSQAWKPDEETAQTSIISQDGEIKSETFFTF